MNHLQSLGTLFYIVLPSSIQYNSMQEVPAFITNAVPYFLLLILLEYLYGLLRGRSVYNARDFIGSLSLGMVQQIIGVGGKALSIFPYCYLFENYRVFHRLPCDNEIGTFVVALLGCDFYYYCFHRAAHTFHVLWAAHSVHHSGERYNLATALRQGALQNFSSWAYYLPLALIGLPPPIFIAHNQLNTLYQFWIHTEVIDRLPWPLEGFLNTPSHHRLHHQPPGNCNYAGVLIIWDRLFNTFKDERESLVRGVYGLASPPQTFDPIAMNLLHFRRMAFIKASDGSKSMQEDDGNIIPPKLTIRRFFQLLFSVRITHPWSPQWGDFFRGLVQFYPMIDPRNSPTASNPSGRPSLPFVEGILECEDTQQGLTAREASFLRSRSEREGRPMISSVRSVSDFLFVVFFVFIFISCFAVALLLMGPSELLTRPLCSQVLPYVRPLLVSIARHFKDSNEVDNILPQVNNEEDCFPCCMTVAHVLISVLCCFGLSALSVGIDRVYRWPKTHKVD